MTGPLSVGFEEGGHPIPNKRHWSPVVVGGGGLVVTGSSFVGFEVGGHPIPNRRHWSPVVVGGGG